MPQGANVGRSLQAGQELEQIRRLLGRQVAQQAVGHERCAQRSWMSVRPRSSMSAAETNIDAMTSLACMACLAPGAQARADRAPSDG
jgi:hypothetical protein